LAWNPNAGNAVFALGMNGTTVFAGGQFINIGGQTRNDIAAINAETGTAMPWNPNANGNIWALAVIGNTVYAGGEFDSIGGQYRNYIAAIDTTGTATSWDPSPNLNVTALAVSGNTVYVGGWFTSICGQTRKCFAAVDATTCAAKLWNPNANQNPYAMAVSGNTVYAGGGFTIIGGQNRSGIAALDTETGTATAWNPNANYVVNALAVSGNTVYAGGFFTNIGGQDRSCIAAIDAISGNATGWNPNSTGTICSGGVNAITVKENIVYVGGCFKNIGGQPRNCIAALDSISGTATAWNPNTIANLEMDLNVQAIAVSKTNVYVGGSFNSIGQGLGHPCFAQFPISTTRTSHTYSPAINNMFALRTTGRVIYFSYSLPQSAKVTLRLYGFNGKLKNELVNAEQPAGTYNVNPSRIFEVPGPYLVVFKAGNICQKRLLCPVW
jgi:hypothetical protein